MSWFAPAVGFLDDLDAPPVAPSRPLVTASGWPVAENPEAVGLDSGRLKALITRGVLGDAAIVRFGKVGAVAGNPFHPRGWASTARGVVATPRWLVALTRGEVPGGLATLDRPIRAFGTPVALTFPPTLTLAQALGYLSEHNQWSYSRWWREMDDLFRELTGRTLHEAFDADMRPVLPGIVAYVNEADGTPRFRATPLDAARWGAWMLAEGGGMVDPALFRRAMTPGPFPVEAFGGWHLIRGGKAWELDLRGCPDGVMARSGGSHDGVFVFPSLDLVVAAKSGAHAPDTYLPIICGACS